jgi:hypothetical protein
VRYPGLSEVSAEPPPAWVGGAAFAAAEPDTCTLRLCWPTEGK